MRKNTLPVPGFEPFTFWLRTSWLAITFFQGFDSLRLIAWLLLAASTMGDIAEITNSHMSTLPRACATYRAGVQWLHLQPWVTGTTSLWICQLCLHDAWFDVDAIDVKSDAPALVFCVKLWMICLKLLILRIHNDLTKARGPFLLLFGNTWLPESSIRAHGS